MSGDDDGFEIVREGEIPHALIARALLRDSRLTFGAKGLFSFLWDLPVGWRIRSSHLAKIGPQRRDAIRSLLRELEAAGGIRVEFVRGELAGKFAGKKWILRSPHLWAAESPLSRPAAPEAAPAKESNEGRETRLSAKPTIGKPTPTPNQAEAFSSSAPAKKDRTFDLRFSGIVTWVAADVAAAERLERETDPVVLAAAIAAVAARGKDPVPGLVARESMALGRRCAAAAEAAAKKAAEAVKGSVPRHPEAAQNGIAAAKEILRS